MEAVLNCDELTGLFVCLFVVLNLFVVDGLIAEAGLIDDDDANLLSNSAGSIVGSRSFEFFDNGEA